VCGNVTEPSSEVGRLKTLQQARRDKQATLDSFKVKRDGEGKIIPQKAETTFGVVMAVPMTYGDAEAMAERSKEEGGLDCDAVATYLRKHIISPDMGSVTGEIVKEDFKAMAVKALLDAVSEVSGMKDLMDVEVSEDGTAKVSLKND